MGERIFVASIFAFKSTLKITKSLCESLYPRGVVNNAGHHLLHGGGGGGVSVVSDKVNLIVMIIKLSLSITIFYISVYLDTISIGYFAKLL